MAKLAIFNKIKILKVSGTENISANKMNFRLSQKMLKENAMDLTAFNHSVTTLRNC